MPAPAAVATARVATVRPMNDVTGNANVAAPIAKGGTRRMLMTNSYATSRKVLPAAWKGRHHTSM